MYPVPVPQPPAIAPWVLPPVQPYTTALRPSKGGVKMGREHIDYPSEVGNDRRKARLWTAASQNGNGYDGFFPIWDWPHWTRQQYLSNHLSYKERLRYFKFFIHNGASPQLAYEFTRANDARFVNGRWELFMVNGGKASHSDINYFVTHPWYLTRDRVRLWDMTKKQIVMS